MTASEVHDRKDKRRASDDGSRIALVCTFLSGRNFADADDRVDNGKSGEGGDATSHHLP